MASESSEMDACLIECEKHFEVVIQAELGGSFLSVACLFEYCHEFGFELLHLIRQWFFFFHLIVFRFLLWLFLFLWLFFNFNFNFNFVFVFLFVLLSFFNLQLSLLLFAQFFAWILCRVLLLVLLRKLNLGFFLGFYFCYCIFVFIFLFNQSLLQFSFIFFAHLLSNSVFVIHFHCSQSRNYIQLIVFFPTVLFRILLQNFKNFLVLESGFECFIFSNETNSQQSIPFKKINVWKRIFRFDSHNTGFNLWWWLEVVFSDLY